jgi:glycosyltransferase involved in cell wall biosynthesis
MKLLLTLDFPPEHGGIQKYLYERVVHTYRADDRVAIGVRGAPLPPLPCPAVFLTNFCSRFNRKWSVVTFIGYLLSHKKTLLRGAEIECGNLYAAIAPWLASILLNVNYRVFTYGGELLALQRPSLKALVFKNVLRRASIIYALGNYTRELLRKAGIEKEVVIEPPRIGPLPDVLFHPLRPVEAFTAAAPLRLLAVGRLVVHKGHEVLIDACRRFSGDLPWRLTLVGNGPMEHRLAALAEKPDLYGRIILRSKCSDDELGVEYRGADLFVHPSLETADGAEGFGIVLLEAMAHGVPVVASRCGGIPEVLDNGRCGALVEAGSPEALARMIVALAKDLHLRQCYVDRALHRLKEQYVRH